MSALATADIRQAFDSSGQQQMETPELIMAAQDVLVQGLELLFKLADRTYSQVAAAPFNASMGQHYRHILEHFHSLIRGLRNREINYDARDRNPRLQSEVAYASIATCDVLRALKRYSEETLALPCGVINSVGYGTSKPSTFESNVSRELAYCIGHAIHHYAIIRLIAHEAGITVPDEFGVAPSTLKYAASLAAD